MKIFSLFLFQVVFLNLVFTQTNGDCYSALPVSHQDTSILIINSTNCVNGMAKASFVLTISNSYGDVDSSSNLPVYGFSNAMTSTYTVYGPFNSAVGICDAIASMQAPIHTTGQGNSNTGNSVSCIYEAGKTYLLEVVFPCGYHEQEDVITLSVDNRAFVGEQEIPCGDCIPKFQPMNKTFVLSAWVKQESSDPNITDYTAPVIQITVAGQGVQTFSASGQIIDGWQRIEGTFVASNAGDITLVCLNQSSDVNVYFDDIRIFPTDGSMLSYVYDQENLRLMAELDERNYATFYEYDEEGKLIRVKKETVKGIMTIQENRDNNPK